MERYTLFTTWTLFAVGTASALAGIPLPDAVLFSKIVVNGDVADAGDDITIIARCGDNDVAEYKMGDVPNAGDSFVLRIPVESLADGADPSDKAIRLGDIVNIFVVQNAICNGGDNAGQPCVGSEECPGGSCGGVESFVTSTCIEDLGATADLDLLCSGVEGPQRAGFAKNRYLSFSSAAQDRQVAVRVSFVELPGLFSSWNGLTMWVGPPRDVTENGALDGPLPAPTSKMATLQCTPHYMDWSTVGTVHVYHEGVVPGGSYVVQGIAQECNTEDEGDFTASLEVGMARWGDVGGPFEEEVWSAPDGSVDFTDVVAIIGKFVNAPTAPIKARVDFEPATPDQLINISDALFAILAFQGLPYPFPPGSVPCGLRSNPIR